VVRTSQEGFECPPHKTEVKTEVQYRVPHFIARTRRGSQCSSYRLRRQSSLLAVSSSNPTPHACGVCNNAVRITWDDGRFDENPQRGNDQRAFPQQLTFFRCPCRAFEVATSVLLLVIIGGLSFGRNSSPVEQPIAATPPNPRQNARCARRRLSFCCRRRARQLPPIRFDVELSQTAPPSSHWSPV